MTDTTGEHNGGKPEAPAADAAPEAQPHGMHAPQFDHEGFVTNPPLPFDHDDDDGDDAA